MRKKSITTIWVAISLAALAYLAFNYLNKDKVVHEPGTCYIKTGMLTQLLHEPDLFAASITTLPRNKEYVILEIRKIQHVGTEYMFLVEDTKKGLKGWVHTSGLSYTDPSCFN